MGKRYKDKAQCLLYPLKCKEELFYKKALHGGKNFFGQIFWEMFYMGTNDQIMQGGNKWLRGFKGRFKLVFTLIDHDLGY